MNWSNHHEQVEQPSHESIGLLWPPNYLRWPPTPRCFHLYLNLVTATSRSNHRLQVAATNPLQSSDPPMNWFFSFSIYLSLFLSISLSLPLSQSIWFESLIFCIFFFLWIFNYNICLEVSKMYFLEQIFGIQPSTLKIFSLENILQS